MNALELPSDATLLVASDMHLGAHDPDTAEFFTQNLLAALPGCSHLLLAGDVFEAWPGDDFIDSVTESFVEQLTKLAASVDVFVMHGNRDFLLNQTVADLPPANQFAQRVGVRMLHEPCVLTLANQRVLLMHGDSLCTDDLAYQQWRQTCRQPQWQSQFLGMPLADRLKTAADLRKASEQGKQQKTEQIMDVNQQAVDQQMTAANCDTLLHGHTHRPQIHQWQFDGRARQRVVLSDWHGATTRGDFAQISAAGIFKKPVCAIRPSG